MSSEAATSEHGQDHREDGVAEPDAAVEAVSPERVTVARPTAPPVAAKGSAAGRAGSMPVLLFLLFLTLKLTGVIDWSWWWVTAPLWMGLAVFVVLGALLFLSFFAGVGALAGILGIFGHGGSRRG